MKKDFFTIRELSYPENLGKSPNWIRCAIRNKLIQAERAGATYIVKKAECERVKRNMPTISREAYFSVAQD